MKKTLISLLLAGTLVVGLVPTTALAQNIQGEQSRQVVTKEADSQGETIKIFSFEPLDKKIATQKVIVGTTLEKLKLPETLIVNVEEIYGQEVIEITNVKWKEKTGTNKFDSKDTGKYIFTPVLEANYTVAPEVKIPEIIVYVSRAYQNPSKYYQIQDDIKLRESGGYKLNIGYMGQKVYYVNKYFGIGNKYWPRYTTLTKSKVKDFQKKKGLKATGVVDEKTWLKMGYSKSNWVKLGGYASKVMINGASTKEDCIEAMISRAKDYIGDNYVVGSSAAPGKGVDCSGLVMQALFAAGIDPYPITPVRHAKPGYEYESRNMWESKKLKTVSYSDRKRGDLIFYHNGYGTVIHVAIYLGKNKVIDSWPNSVAIRTLTDGSRSHIKGVKRVFI
ncbi:MAG: NlpC/P60 family protein [Anaerovoracaceae bacterium]